MLTSTTKSSSEISPRNGIVNAYTVAARSTTSSRPCSVSSDTIDFRKRSQPMAITIGQAMPMSSRLAPVMFATA